MNILRSGGILATTRYVHLLRWVGPKAETVSLPEETSALTHPHYTILGGAMHTLSTNLLRRGHFLPMPKGTGLRAREIR